MFQESSIIGILLCITIIIMYHYAFFFFIIAGVMYPYVNQPEAFSLESLMNGPVREALGIEVRHGSQSGKVFDYLTEDFMKPVIHIGNSQVY